MLQLDCRDAPAELRRWWLIVEDGEVDLCQSDPGFEVDLYVSSTASAWTGKAPLSEALDDEEIDVDGERELRRSFGRPLKLSAVVDGAREPGLLRAS